MKAIQDGDVVALRSPARVDGYWFCESTMVRGCWTRMHLLPGSLGRVVRANTPCIQAGPKGPKVFANVDIKYMGETLRVRVFHKELIKLRQAEPSQLAQA